MLGFSLVLMACLLWALDTLIRYPLSESGINPISIVFWEHLLLSLLFLTINFSFLKRLRTIGKSFWGFVTVGCVGSALATVCFTKAFTILNPSLVIILQKFQPIFAIILARLVLKETVKKGFIFWSLISLVGAFLISYDDLYKLAGLKLTFDNQEILMGYGLVLVSVVGWASSTVMSKWLVNLGKTNEDILTGRFLFGFFALVPFFFSAGQLSIETSTLSQISLMVLISGVLAMYLYYKGLRRISAKTCSLVELFFPFFAVIVNWYFLNATLSYIQILGAFVLLIGSTTIQIKRY